MLQTLIACCVWKKASPACGALVGVRNELKSGNVCLELDPVDLEQVRNAPCSHLYAYAPYSVAEFAEAEDDEEN